MHNLFKLYWLVVLASGLLFADCYATDSTKIFKLVKTSTASAVMSQAPVLDDQDCESPQEVKKKAIEQTNRWGKTNKSASACPPSYPYAHDVISTVQGAAMNTTTSITVRCCKTKIDKVKTA